MLNLRTRLMTSGLLDPTRYMLRTLAVAFLVAAGVGVQAQSSASAPVAAVAAPSTSASAATATTGTTAASPASAVNKLTLPADAASANPYGLRAVLDQGDLVTHLTLLILAVMSLLSWYIMVAKLLEQRRTDAQVAAARKAIASNEPLLKRTDAVPKGTPLRALVDSALDAARRHFSLANQVDMNTWLTQDIVRSVSTLQMRAQEGLSILATVGATAPFVGLFGTVWGIYNALVTIGVSGQASIDKVAGPVGEALIMTALGLAVAVPAVLGYNGLVRRSRTSMHAVKGFGSELHTQLLIELEKSQRAPVATPN